MWVIQASSFTFLQLKVNNKILKFIFFFFFFQSRISRTNSSRRPLLQSVRPHLRPPPTSLRHRRRLRPGHEQPNVVIVDRIASSFTVVTPCDVRSHASQPRKSRFGLHDAVKHDKRKCDDARYFSVDAVVFSFADVNWNVA
jgi:hypothetical protein